MLVMVNEYLVLSYAKPHYSGSTCYKPDLYFIFCSNSSVHGIVGLPNLGNTCYLNAAAQVLHHAAVDGKLCYASYIHVYMS